MTVRIVLERGEMAYANSIASAMYISNLAQNVQEQIATTRQSAFDIHFTGVIAEVAFSKWQKLFRTPSVHVKPHSYDFDWNGMRLDIKSSTNVRSDLIAKKNTPTFQADVYALAIVQGNIVDFIGYAMNEDFINPKRLKRMNSGDTVYLIPRSELIPFHDAEHELVEEEWDGFL
jgi:hypothetical protein